MKPINGKRPFDFDVQQLRPYCVAGADRLTSHLWKFGSEDTGYRFRFNVMRQEATGSVSQTFRPSDLASLIKLTQVLASILVDDGCISQAERRALKSLAQRLDLFVQQSRSISGNMNDRDLSND